MNVSMKVFSSDAGNRALFDLTSRGDYKLVVDLNFTNGDVRQAVYDTFKVAGPDDFYRLTVGGFSGNAGRRILFGYVHTCICRHVHTGNSSGAPTSWEAVT